MPSYPAYGSPSPPHNRFRDHTPTKSSPLRHAISTRSVNSDADDSVRPPAFPIDTTTGRTSCNAHDLSTTDPFVTRKRERSESPAKKNSAFAKWEQRAQAEQDQSTPRTSSTMNVSPKKIRDEEWRAGIGRSESRSALRPVTQNAATEKHVSPVHNVPHSGTESKENVHLPTLPQDGRTSPSPSSRAAHKREDSLDGSFKPTGLQTSPTKNSLATLSRSDSMRASTRPSKPRGHARFTSVDHAAPHLDGADLDQLQKSSTPQLRHLSKMATEDGGTEDLSVHSAEEQVAGLTGRRKLQRSGSLRPRVQNQSQFSSQYASTRWMDTQRKHLQAYEYLCHIGEARAWIEDVLDPEKLPPIVQLEEALRDGVTLAEVVVRLAHSLPDVQQRALGSKRIFRNSRLQFRHSDNIALFFRFLAEIELPELFRFELVDLYEKKNIPKVIYCIHALSWLLFRKGIVDFRIGNLVGQLQFEEHELEETQKGIDRSGVQMPNFGGMREAMQVEVEPTPEEKLAEHEALILDLQSQIRGVLVRRRLGDVMQDLWDAEVSIVQLQAIARGGFHRQVFDFRYAMDASTRHFQAAAKAFLVRRQARTRQRGWQQNEPSMLALQSLWRGRKQRILFKAIQFNLESNRGSVQHFQAAVRGALGRWRAGDLWHETRNAKTEAGVVAFQAAARGALERSRVGGIMNAMWDTEAHITALQAGARGAHIRKENKRQQVAARQTTVDVVRLQSAIRGFLLQHRQRKEHAEREAHDQSVTKIQAASRGLLERLRHARIKGTLQGRESVIVKFQTLLRAQATRAAHEDTRERLDLHAADMSSLQAIIRASAFRASMVDTQTRLKLHADAVLALQSLARAMLLRKTIGGKLAALEDQEDRLIALQGLARGHIQRQFIFDQLVAMEKQEASITRLQAMARAVLLRGHVGGSLAELEDHEPLIVELQATLRGLIVRKRFAERRRHYRRNMEKVIKLQSFVRAKQQGESYKSLVNGKNPPLPVVRRHVHLLTDSHLEFEGELEAERLRRQVVESVRRNELVESYVEGLDVKIALLVKNKITLDEVVKHQKHFGGSASQLLRSGSSLAQPTGLDLKALNKNSRKKLTGYEELFFLLQTNPQYLAGLFAQLSARGLAEKEGKNLERLILTLFGYSQKSREEYLLLKVLAASTQQIVSNCQTTEDFMRQQCGTFQQRIVLSYVRGPSHRAHLKALLGDMIKNGICGQNHLDLESDPLQIYRAILNNEELSTGRPSQRPKDLPREAIIRQEDVRPKYVENLEDLRDLGDGFFQSLEDYLHRMPFGLRFLAKAQHQALCAQFPRDDPSRMAMVAGSWLWKSYFLPALREPEMWGVIDRGLSPLHKRNLAQVVTVLGQVAGVGHLFGAENIYLQPLNNWITESLGRWHECLHRLFDIPSAEEYYDADQFSDLYARTKPTLYIKLPDIFAFHRCIAENAAAMAPARDDPLKELLIDLGTAKSNETDLGGATNGGEITLTLKSRFTVQEDPNSEPRALFTATKRLVLYIIRVQSGNNLMEILLRPITHDDADRWIALVHEEMAEKERDRRRPARPNSSFDPRHSFRGGRTQSMYSEAPSTFSEDRRDLLDLQNMTYAELKSTALENILALEQAHIPAQFRVSRHSNYQEILNALAADIRQKHRRRLERQRETESTKVTLSQLDAKANYLEEQLKSYNDYIEQCLHTLASKKSHGRSKFILPFTKQWSHERELEKSGRQPKFGSYKYSARQLADKGVLLSWTGYPSDHWSQLNVVISSDEVGVFHIEASSGAMMLPGASGTLMLDDLLQAQYDNQAAIDVFNDAGRGGARLAVNLLLHLVFKKFYRDE